MASDLVEAVADSIAAIPVVHIHPAENEAASVVTSTPNTRTSSSVRSPVSRLKEKLESMALDGASCESTGGRSDKLMNLLLSQLFPSDNGSDDANTDPDSNASAHGTQVKDYRSRTHVTRPSFSLPTMSSNFRRFNARIGVAFIFQNRLIHLFSWKQPTQTLSFLLVWTFVCVNPYLLPVLPLASAMFFIMVPAYLARHPEPENEMYKGSLGGPPLADAKTIKPAPDFSKDFFRNMRDLQNSMDDFSNLHDAVLAILLPLTNFSNESLSSTIYLILLLASCSLFVSAHLLPWRFILLTIGYALTALNHPTIQALLSKLELDRFVTQAEHKGRSLVLAVSKADIELETAPEVRQVEIFELQRRALHNQHGEYESFVFSPSPYAPLSPARIAGDRPRGTPFFEDVLPPRGWRWTDKKWTLDLLSREWVEDRCVTGVEVEVEGERWVTDLHFEALESEEEGEKKRMQLQQKGRLRSHSKGNGKSADDEEKDMLRRTWESHAPSRKGEWRRRRWIRAVKRMSFS